jgi:hypothetical protein
MEVKSKKGTGLKACSLMHYKSDILADPESFLP